MNFIDKAIKAISPERALKREVAKKRLSMINSGYGNYGASATKKSLIGWTHGGGSHREDVEDNIDPLRQRSRDLFYGGSNVATGAIKRLRTNTIGIGLHLKASINEEVLKIEPDSTNCDLERIDNFYQLQQLAFLNALLSGDSFALMTTTKRVGSVYDLRIQTLEADRVSTPDNDRVIPLFCEGVEKNTA